MSDHLFAVDTGIRRTLRECGSERVGVAMVRVFDGLCRGLLKLRSSLSTDEDDMEALPWAVCMGYTPEGDSERLHCVKFWDTNSAVGDFRLHDE